MKFFTLSRWRCSFSSLAAFAVSMLVCGAVLLAIVTSKLHTDQLLMEQLILEKSIQLTEIVHKLLYKTEALAALVIQNNGEVKNFDRVASTLVDDPVIANVLVAPGGVVTHVYPMRGNESVLGFDFFQKGAGNAEALLAEETGSLVFGGPFPLVQGGQALVGRLPVYLGDAAGKQTFWGIVSVTLRYPQILDGLGLPVLEKQGYAFELWRINPDTDKKQVIASSDNLHNNNARFVEKSIHILNAMWYCRISPVRMWYQYLETWILMGGSVFISILVAFVVQNNHNLKHMQVRLEEMASTDALTHISNRRHFVDMAPGHLQQAARKQQTSFVIMFDVDRFKNINDTYGHAAGDLILSGIAATIKGMVRPYDLCARYGGEEFILLVTDMDKKDAQMLSSRIRLRICERPYQYDGKDIPVSASCGLAQILPGSNLETAIRQADEALYRAKREGRNRCVCYDAACSEFCEHVD